MSRRALLKSLSSAALTLMAMNEACARAGSRGGYFNVGREAPYERGGARDASRARNSSSTSNAIM
jgi:hypothetical protein